MKKYFQIYFFLRILKSIQYPYYILTIPKEKIYQYLIQYLVQIIVSKSINKHNLILSNIFIIKLSQHGHGDNISLLISLNVKRNV